jgi:hypothetical protein
MDARFVDNESQRNDRKEISKADMIVEQAGKDAYRQWGSKVPTRRGPNRQARRMAAKKRGIFKQKGAWGYINNRSTNHDNQ